MFVSQLQLSRQIEVATIHVFYTYIRMQIVDASSGQCNYILVVQIAKEKKEFPFSLKPVFLTLHSR